MYHFLASKLKSIYTSIHDSIQFYLNKSSAADLEKK